MGGGGIGFLIDNELSVFQFQAGLHLHHHLGRLRAGHRAGLDRPAVPVRRLAAPSAHRRRSEGNYQGGQSGCGGRLARLDAISSEPAGPSPRGDRAGAARARSERRAHARARALPSEAQLTSALRRLARDGPPGARGAARRGADRRAVAAAPPVVQRGRVLAQSFDQLVSFSLWARQLGRTPAARTLELARRPADAEAAAQLGIEPRHAGLLIHARCGCSTASR